jgi:hypothetical protein
MRKIPAYLLTLAALLLLGGCFSFNPTYSKEKIEEHIVTLCKSEYNLQPKVWLVGETVWIYIPFPSLITKDLQFNKDSIEKINKVIVASSRVVLSMKPRPRFMAVVATDTKEYGIDYTIITWIPDIVKYQLELISRDEYARRTVVRIKENIFALNDTDGAHLQKTDINMGEFLAELMNQNLRLKFASDAKAPAVFEPNQISAAYQDYFFDLKVNIAQKNTLPGKEKRDIQRETLEVVAYLIKEYEFKDFLLVRFEDSASGQKASFSRLALRDYLKKK